MEISFDPALVVQNDASRRLINEELRLSGSCFRVVLLSQGERDSFDSTGILPFDAEYVATPRS